MREISRLLLFAALLSASTVHAQTWSGTVADIRSGTMLASSHVCAGILGRVDLACTDSGSDGRWEVKGGMLYMSEGAGQLEPVDLKVTYNSNGSPILTADGVEYCRCD